MITKLENRFEDLKEKFSKEEIVLIMAKFEVEEILEKTELALSILKNTNNEDETKKHLLVLHKQVKEFAEFIDDLIKEKMYFQES